MMKALKHFVGIILALLVLSTPIAADDLIIFSDITGHWAESDIYYLADKELLNGYTNGTFLPQNAITRAEFVTILAKDAKVDLEQYSGNSTYSDTKTHWAKNAINWAGAVGVAKGYGNGTFKPSQKISREELATMLHRHIISVKKNEIPAKYKKDTFNDDAKISAWAKDAVYYMQMRGIITGREHYMFDPKNETTRAETSAMMARYLRLINGVSGSSSTAALYVNNKLKISNLPVENSRNGVAVPLRKFIEALNYTVDYYGNTNLAVVYNHTSDMEMWMGRSVAYGNGNQVGLSLAPYTSNGSTMASPTDIGKALGISVTLRDWDGNEPSIAVTFTPMTVSPISQSFYGSALGTAATGEINLNDGRFLGKVTNGNVNYGNYTSKNKFRYFGSWSNNNMNGNGRSINSLGELSIGTFRDGHLSNGITYFADGSVFEGEWYYNTSSSALYPSKGTLTANGKTYGSPDTSWSGGALTVQ